MEMNIAARYIFDRQAGLELVVSHGKKAAFPPHTHISTVTVILVRSGTLCLTNCFGDQTLTKGCSVVIQPHALHSIIAPSAYSVASLCLGAQFFSSEIQSENYDRINRFLAQLEALGVLRSEECARFFDSLSAHEVYWESADDAIARLRKDIEVHPEQNVTLDEMAEAVYLDKGHFIRCFKKRFGLTPCNFRIQCRIRKARLEFMGNASLTQAAYMAGFYDQSHFIRNFKKFYGVTPRDYLSACRSIAPYI